MKAYKILLRRFKMNEGVVMEVKIKNECYQKF